MAEKLFTLKGTRKVNSSHVRVYRKASVSCEDGYRYRIFQGSDSTATEISDRYIGPCNNAHLDESAIAASHEWERFHGEITIEFY